MNNNDCNEIKVPSFKVRVNIFHGRFCLISTLSCFDVECVDMKLHVCHFDIIEIFLNRGCRERERESL